MGNPFLTNAMTKLVTDYLERPVHFERMAASETDENLKAHLKKSAVDYYELAEKRAKELGSAEKAAADANLSLIES